MRSRFGEHSSSGINLDRIYGRVRNTFVLFVLFVFVAVYFVSYVLIFGGGYFPLLSGFGVVSLFYGVSVIYESFYYC